MDWLDQALDGDGGLTLVQQPIARPDPVQRPGEVAPRHRQVAPPPRAQQTPAAAASQAAAPAVPQDFFLPNERIEKLSPAERDAYIKQRNEWFDYRQGLARETVPQPRQQAPATQAPQTAAPPQKPAQPPQAGRGDDFLFEPPSAPAPRAPAAPSQPSAGNPNAEPDATTWVGRRAQDVMGKTDKRFADLPTIAEVMLKDKTHRIAPEVGSWLVGASDKDMGGVYRNMLGDRFVRDETDANGFPIVVYRGTDGGEARAYVNKPGLDMQDVVRGAVGVAPYVGVGRLIGGAMKGASLVPKMAGQSMGAAATSVAQDAVGVASGVSDLDVDKTAEKAGIAAIGGAGGELIGAGVSALVRRFITEPKYFNRATGALTEAGEAAARQAGLDPKMLARAAAADFGKAMARTGDPAAATRQAVTNEFKVPRTQGEMAGDTQQLLREQQMVGGTYGDRARQGMTEFRKGQDESIANAVRGEIEAGKPGIAGQLAPDRAGARLGKDELGGNIRANTEAAYDVAREAEKEAWKNTPKLTATPEMLADLPGAIAARASNVMVDELTTPAAAKMAQALTRFQKGEAPAKAAEILPNSPLGDVTTMRKNLLGYVKAAATPEDKRAAGALYDAYNDSVVTAAQKAGDPAIAAQMVTARGLSRQIHEIFDGPQGTAGAKILGNVLKKSDSAEGVVNALFSAPSKSEIKGGAITALAHLKRAYDTYLEPTAAKAAWDDIRLAYWMRIVESKGGGEVAGPMALSSGIKNAINSQRSVMNMLYAPEEIAKMQRMAMLLDDIKRRNPNTSWSAIGVGALFKDAGNAVLSMIGANSIIGRTAVGTVMKPLQHQYGAAQMRAATGGGQGAAVPRLPLPSYGGIGAGIGAESQSR